MPKSSPRKATKPNSALMKRLRKAVKNAFIHSIWDYQEYGLEGHFDFSNENRFRWAPLSKEYELRKRKEVGNQPMLVFSGKLKGSVVGKGTITEIRNGVRLTFPQMPDYGEYVKEVRDFLTPDDEDQETMNQAAQDYLDAQANTEGFLNPRQDI